MFNIWIRAITQPVLATYEALLQEEPNPTLGQGVKWVALAGLIAGAISGFLTMIFGIAQGQPAGALFGGWIVTVIVVPIVTVIGFVIGSAILLVIARALGGQGNMGSQSYLLAAAGAPISIISAALGSIPVAGIVLSLLATLYGLWLDVLGLRAAHRYGWARAVFTVLIPMLLLAALCLIPLLLLGPVVDRVYQQILEQTGG